MQTSAGPRGAAHPSHLSSRTRDCAMGAVPLCRRERAQLGPAAAAAGLSLAAPILSVHASHHARSRLSTLSCRRPVSDLPQLLFALEGPTAGEPAADAADDRRRFFRSLTLRWSVPPDAAVACGILFLAHPCAPGRARYGVAQLMGSTTGCTPTAQQATERIRSNEHEASGESVCASVLGACMEGVCVCVSAGLPAPLPRRR